MQPQAAGYSQVPLIIPIAFNVKEAQRRLNRYLAIMVLPLIFLFILIIADDQANLETISLSIIGFFAAVYALARSMRGSAITQALAPLISADSNTVTLPAGIKATRVVASTSGYYRRGYKSRTTVDAMPISEPTQVINWRDNPWGAVSDKNGVGWFQASAYQITEGPFKDVMLVPIQPSKLEGRYDVLAVMEEGSASAEVRVDGPLLSGMIHQPTSDQIKACQLRIRGKSGTNQGVLTIKQSDDNNSFSFNTQPSVPLVLVAHKRLFTPAMIAKVLTLSNLIPGTMFGGVGTGDFSAELVIDTEKAKGIVFPSQPIPY
jgi:hypothetical protein